MKIFAQAGRGEAPPGGHSDRSGLPLSSSFSLQLKLVCGQGAYVGKGLALKFVTSEND